VHARNTKRILAAAGVLFVATCCSPSFALQRVTLRSGFSYDCSSTQPIQGAALRLFLYASSPADASQAANFIDIAQQSIASIETLPDPPAPAPARTPDEPTQTVHDLLTHAGAQHDIDVDLLASVIKAESGGRIKAVSRTGARGLMQLMPGTAQQLGVDDAFRPDQNIAGGTAYLDQLLTRYQNNLSLALAAYNAGPAAVDRYHGIPPYAETRAYVARVEREFKRRKLASERQVAQHPLAALTATQTVAALGSH
jgi:soluble lytic murein transglycosylase-like protein